MFERLSKEHPVPKRRLFSLLARVRAAVAWGGGLEARRGAVRRRIMALTALVYCHPSQGDGGYELISYKRSRKQATMANDISCVSVSRVGGKSLWYTGMKQNALL